MAGLEGPNLSEPGHPLHKRILRQCGETGSEERRVDGGFGHGGAEGTEGVSEAGVVPRDSE